MGKARTYLTRWINNKRLSWKFLMVFLVMQLAGYAITAGLYYRYSSRSILQTYSDRMDEDINLIGNTIFGNVQAIFKSVFAVTTDESISLQIEKYNSLPDAENFVKLNSLLEDRLRSIQYINKDYVRDVVLCTGDQVFTNYAIGLRPGFRYRTSVFNTLTGTILNNNYRKFPVMEDPVFRKSGKVIPLVVDFQIGSHQVHIIILIAQRAIEDYLGSFRSFEALSLIDDTGGVIASSKTFPGGLADRTGTEKGTVSIGGDPFLVSYGEIQFLDWKIVGAMDTVNLTKDLRALQGYIFLILLVLMCGELFLVRHLTRTITKPLRELTALMDKPLDQRFDTNFEYPYSNEIGILSKSYNEMTDEIANLIDRLNEKISDLKEREEQLSWEQQQTRKAEIAALQAQVQPHFLYNTLNTISWLAVEGKQEEVAKLTNALGRFYQISLSSGAEFVSLGTELEQVRNYLLIQAFRFQDILSYEIVFPPELEAYSTVKILLQPLVENALYHGLKPKGTKGTVRITGKDLGTRIAVEVYDNGVGIPKKTLEEITRTLQEGVYRSKTGYGIYNVNARIRLTYGKAYGLTLESEEGKWTRSSICIPKEKREEALS